MELTPHQTLFNTRYITSSEVRERLGVSRPTLHHHRRAGHLPNAIEINGQTFVVWERDFIEPYLLKWEESKGGKRDKQE